MNAVENQNEIDTRLNILNTLLTTPHRELGKVYPVHMNMAQQDPLFYSQLAAWYADKGEIRDHKEMFVVNLCLSNFDGHRELGLALLREMPPYQLVRVVDFISGRKTKKKVTTVTGRGRARVTRVTEQVEDFGLFKNVPRSVKTEVARYLREREKDNSWFDSSVLVARKYMKRLYALLHIEPSERAQAILFEENPPEDSSLMAVKELGRCESAAEQAKVIVKHKVPYRVASTVINAMTPTVIAALVEVMSDQELMNNLGSLKKRGAFDNPDIAEVIKQRLEKAKTSKRVAALKTKEIIQASGVSADVQKQLEDITDTQLKSKGRIKQSTALIIDKSGSMEVGIELGKRIGAMISTIMDAPLYVYACDTVPYTIKADGDDHAAWENAFRGIRASGGTSCGIGIEMLRRNQQVVQQIIMVTDEGETTSPPFLTTLQNYCKEFNVNPHVLFVKCGSPCNKLEGLCQRNNISYDAYEFKGDYYGLPSLIPYLTNSSRVDLLMEVMSYPLPERKTA